jgi:hypothetical protein
MGPAYSNAAHSNFREAFPERPPLSRGYKNKLSLRIMQQLRTFGLFEGRHDAPFQAPKTPIATRAMLSAEQKETGMDWAHVALAFLLMVHSIGGVLIAIRITRLFAEISSTVASINALIDGARRYQGRVGIFNKNGNLD